MNIQGQLIEIYDTKQVSEKLKKREFVIQDNENPQYPQYIKFELAQDKCSLLDSHSIGEMIDVSFNVRGRSYEKNGVKSYFISLQCWKINAVSGASQEPIKEPTIGEKREAMAMPEDYGLPF